jgi:hypothetical protein
VAVSDGFRNIVSMVREWEGVNVHRIVGSVQDLDTGLADLQILTKNVGYTFNLVYLSNVR